MFVFVMMHCLLLSVLWSSAGKGLARDVDEQSEVLVDPVPEELSNKQYYYFM